MPKSLSFDILIRSISCGAQHTLLLSKRGELFSIGSNEFGQLGLNDKGLEFTTAPLLIQQVQNERLDIKQIDCGAYHCALVTYGGGVYTWGSNQQAQCGIKNDRPYGEATTPGFKGYDYAIQTPTRVNVAFSATKVECGYENTACLTSHGLLFAWGSNNCSQLGYGKGEKYYEPREIRLPDSSLIRDFSFGYDYALIVSEANGRIFGIGNNAFGQLSGADAGEIQTPKLLSGLEGIQASQVMAGSTFSAALQAGQIYIWGTGPFGYYDSP